MTEEINAHSSAISSVAYSPDGKTIVSGSRDHTIKVWGALAFLNCQPELELTSASLPIDAASLTLLSEETNAHSDCINSVAFSPDGKTIVSGSDDQTLKVWDAGER